MDNPIRLRCILEEEQKAFLGRVPEENLFSICNEVVPCTGAKFVIAAVKMVLGREFMENENRYRVNSDITSQFLASLLDLGEPRVESVLLLRKIFKAVYLGDVIEIVAHAVLGVGIPWAGEVHKLLEPGQNVVLQPFLLGLTAGQLKHHRKCAIIGLDFLRKWFFLDEVEDGDDWLQDFATMVDRLDSGRFYDE
jgi:hypothetical protein